MGKRFCPKCGINIESGTFCESCQKKDISYETPLIQVSEFQRTFHKGSWHLFNDLDQLIKKRVCEALGKKIDITVEPYEFIFQAKEKIDVIARAVIEGKEIELPVRLSYRQCDYGQKSKTQYFEGILQLRNATKDVQDFIGRELKKVSKKGSFITKTVETKKGVDLYFTEKNHMKLIAQKVNIRFGGIIKINPQLFSFSHLESKNLYRLNILVELPEFTVGDIISYIHTGTRNRDGKLHYVKIEKMGKLLQATDIMLAKHVALEMRYASEQTKLTKQKSSIASTKPELMIINPETFQSERVANIKGLNRTYEVEDIVLVVFTNQGWCILES